MNTSQNFIQLDFKNALTGAAINTVYLTGDEVPAGIKRNENRYIVPAITTMGKARTFPHVDGIEFSWEIVLFQAETVNKLDLIQTYIGLGYIVDAKALTGPNTYASGSDSLAYNATKATVLNAVIVEFPNDWRQMIAAGLRARVVVPMRVREGASFALPTAAQWTNP